MPIHLPPVFEHELMKDEMISAADEMNYWFRPENAAKMKLFGTKAALSCSEQMKTIKNDQCKSDKYMEMIHAELII